MNSISTPDLLIFSTYIIILLVIGLWAGKKQKNDSAEDFFLTNKTLPWYAIGFSIIAAGVSSEQFLGTVGFAYQYGLSVANWEWLNGPAILLLAFIFIPFYIRKKVVTMPQFLEMRYNRKVRSLFAIITIATYIFINLAGVIFSGGYALNKIFGIDMYFGIWAVTLIAGFFTVYGGMESVVWTNVFQSILLLGGGLTIFFIGLDELPGGFQEMLGSGERAHLILPSDHEAIPATGLIVLAISTNVWFFCTNQTINQAALGAKNEWHARIGILFAGFLAILVALADTFPGMIAYALNPNLAEADSAYPFVVDQMIPIGFKGLVFAGLCGAIISTIEAIGNAGATIFTFDIYKEFINPGASNKKMIKVGRIAIVVILGAGALWAPIVLFFGHIFSYFQESWAFIAIPVVVIFVFGVLWKGMTGQAAYFTLLLSFPLFCLPYVLRLTGIKANPFNIAGFVLIFTILFAVFVSSLKKEHASEDWALKKWIRNVDEKKPFYSRPIFWAIVMVAIYVGIYIKFW